MGIGSDEIVERIVNRLRALARTFTLEFSLTVGKLVIDEIYGGNVEHWRRRGPKELSLRRLVKHPRLPMSPSALYRSIAIYDLCQRIRIDEWKNLSSSHLRLVLPLPENEQLRLLELAEANAWSVRRLDEEIAAALLALPTRPKAGPRRNSSMQLHVRRVTKAVGALAECVETSLDPSRRSPENVREATDALRRALEICSRFEPRQAAEGGARAVDDAYERPRA
jgi:hypothetical protein